MFLLFPVFWILHSKAGKEEEVEGKSILVLSKHYHERFIKGDRNSLFLPPPTVIPQSLRKYSNFSVFRWHQIHSPAFGGKRPWCIGSIPTVDIIEALSNRYIYSGSHSQQATELELKLDFPDPTASILLLSAALYPMAGMKLADGRDLPWSHIWGSYGTCLFPASKISVLASIGKDVEKLKPSCVSGGNVKWLQLLWKTIWWFLKWLNIKSPYDIVDPHPVLGLYPRDLKAGTWTDTCSLIFIIVLFSTAKRWKQLTCPAVDEWVNRMWSVHTPYCLVPSDNMCQHSIPLYGQIILAKYWMNYGWTLKIF